EPAMTRGLIEIVRLLIDTEPVLPLSEPRVSEGLYKAAAAGRVELMQLLLRHTSVELWEELRQDLLLIAVVRQQADMIGLLLEHGADPNPPLRIAFQRKLHGALRALAGHGVDLNKAIPLQGQRVRTVDAQFDPLGRQQLPSLPTNDDPP